MRKRFLVLVAALALAPASAFGQTPANHQGTRPWAKAIREAVVIKKMPPWFADPRFGHFENDRRLVAFVGVIVDPKTDARKLITMRQPAEPRE